MDDQPDLHQNLQDQRVKEIERVACIAEAGHQALPDGQSRILRHDGAAEDHAVRASPVHRRPRNADRDRQLETLVRAYNELLEARKKAIGTVMSETCVESQKQKEM